MNDDDRIPPALRRLLEVGIKPHAEKIAEIAARGDIAVVVFEVDDMFGDRRLIETSKAGLRALGWRGENVFALNRTRATRLLADADAVTARWVGRRQRGVTRIFVAMHTGTLLVNLDAEGYSLERGSPDADWLAKLH